MRQIYSDDSRLAHSILDAIPAVIIIADSDLTIYDVNTAASGSLELYKDAVFMKRGGEALKCVNSDKVPKGCGHSSACSECILTNTYNEALKGNKVTRNHARMEVRRGDKIVELHLLVTASPFTFEGKQLTLIILEDIAELIKLRSIIPICANCKKSGTMKIFGKVLNNISAKESMSIFRTPSVPIAPDYSILNYIKN